jgi:hypothetical protein
LNRDGGAEIIDSVDVYNHRGQQFPETIGDGFRMKRPRTLVGMVLDHYLRETTVGT